jgi:hypothetical protein
MLGKKFDTGKPEFVLFPPYAMEEVAKVLTYGANSKYGRDNWKNVEDAEYRYLNAAFRHLNTYIKGEHKDPETGLEHLAHCICCLSFILDSNCSGTPLPENNNFILKTPNVTYNVKYNFNMKENNATI